MNTLASGASQEFYVLATALAREDDEMENWNVKVSNQDGINQNSPPDPQTQIRVLSVDSIDVVSPEGVLDYRGTKGQTITLESTISNHSTVPLNIDGKLTTTSGDSKTELEDKISTPPGVSADFHFSVVLGDPGIRGFLASATDPTGNQATSLSSDDFEVRPKPAFTYRAGSMSPTASVSGASQTFSL